MQNGTNISLTKGSVILTKASPYSGVPVKVAKTTFSQNVIKASRTGKRPKPAYLLPRYGTASEIHTDRVNLLQVGRDNPLASWKPYTNTSSREFDCWEIENMYVAAGRSVLIQMEDLSPLIQNKIREEIMSGKAQLAVDLVELKKTKSMMADAAVGLWQAYRDLRGGRPFATFVRTMQREGFRSYAGQKWHEYIYGWAPTVSGIYETADVLAKELKQGSIVTDKVRAKQTIIQTVDIPYGKEDRVCIARAKGHYQFTIKDPKLLQLSQLGFTNPLAVAYELLPWSFVLDWFVDVGGYINRMDYALGLEDIYWQYSCHRKSYAYTTYNKAPSYVLLKDQECIAVSTKVSNLRKLPTNVISNTFKGLKIFTNETVRLTSAVALFNQQATNIKRIRST